MLKLINFFDCPYFNSLREDMSAPLAKNFKFNAEIQLLDENLIHKLGREGIDLQFEEIIPQEDKTLSYRGQRVLVYIRDVSNYNNKSDPFPRFHLAYCSKLDQMRLNKRWQRYVVANREDGYFQINLNTHGWKSSTEKLTVCQLCLNALQWENFSLSLSNSNKQKIVSEFSLEKFFKKYPKSLLSVIPNHTSDTAPLNDYTENWASVSESIKRKRHYTCDNCQRVLIGKDKRHLHTHHIDGQKFNNKETNLQVLCLKCHADEHPHMKTSEYKKFLETHG
jgi:hypothetical protein